MSTLRVELGEDAVAMLEVLKDKFGVANARVALARAIGLANIVTETAGDQRMVVVYPGNDEARKVSINLRR